ncbi:MAG TPA: hypothetical protein HPP83_07520 [Candidatus Hydrogenedentes bacterium]|nr:hypothetical protein [Candidatus Hydrogenedentota bacterium]
MTEPTRDKEEPLHVDNCQVYWNLCEDVASLRIKWNLYQDLYCEENIGVLKDTAPTPFSMIEQALRWGITLSICHLSERKKVSGCKQFSIVSLVEALDSPEGFRQEFETFRDQCKPVRDYRNNCVAHKNYEAALKGDIKAELLSQIGKSLIEAIVTAAKDLLEHAFRSGKVGGAEFHFEHVETLGDGKTIIGQLKRAKEARLAGPSASGKRD